VTSKRAFRKDQVSVHGDLEDTAGGGHQADLGVRELLFQLSRQTGGSGLVVSDDAILDDHAHATSPGWLEFDWRIVVVTRGAAKGEGAW
jgi:hypothetical protein